MYAKLKISSSLLSQFNHRNQSSLVNVHVSPQKEIIKMSIMSTKQKISNSLVSLHSCHYIPPPPGKVMIKWQLCSPHTKLFQASWCKKILFVFLFAPHGIFFSSVTERLTEHFLHAPVSSTESYIHPTGLLIIKLHWHALGWKIITKLNILQIAPPPLPFCSPPCLPSPSRSKSNELNTFRKIYNTVQSVPFPHLNKTKRRQKLTCHSFETTTCKSCMNFAFAI